MAGAVQGERARRPGARLWAGLGALGRRAGRQLRRGPRLVAALRGALSRLRVIRARYDSLFHRNPLPIWVFDRESLRILAVNDTAVERYGYSRAEFLSMTILDLRPPEEAADTLAYVRADAPPDDSDRAWRHRLKDGRIIYVNNAGVDIVFDGRPACMVLVRDITDRVVAEAERERFQAEIAHRATHDLLTGLPNRDHLGTRLEAAMARAKAAGGRVVVAFVDLDDFKLVNDSFGHGSGDTVLRAMAGRLGAGLREGDTVARFGGDEFVLLLEEPAGEDAAARLERHVAALLARPVDVGGVRHTLTASVGWCRFPDDGADVEALLRRADLAMYRAKQGGRNATVAYHDGLQHAASARMALLGELRQAIERDEFMLEYQPIFDARGTPVALEALVRWRHPRRGLLPPGEFIPACEESGLVVALGRLVLAHAARTRARLVEAGWGHLRMAVNVSAVQFTPDLPADVARLVREHGLPPGALELELTETVVMAQPERAIPLLEELAVLGVRVVIDDFGTGHSSLAYLRRLPIHGLKIDRCFIAGLGVETADEAICSAVMGLARALGVRVVAEGVECDRQLAWLRERDCCELQGFLLGRPQPIDLLLAPGAVLPPRPRVEGAA